MRINITSMILGSTQYCYEKGIVKSVEIVDEDNMYVVFVDSDKITNKVNICCPATISVEFTQVGKQYRSFVDSFVNRKKEENTGIVPLEDGSRVEEDVELEEIRKQIKMENHWKQACNESESWEMKPDCQCDACIKNRKHARKLKMYTLNVCVYLEGRRGEYMDITLTSDTEGYLIINGVVRYVCKDTAYYTWYEIFPVPQIEEETYMCEKCDKAVKEDHVALFRSIDVNTGVNINVVYCEPCYDNMMSKIYGPVWSAEKEPEEPFTPMEVQICDAFPWDTDHACLTHFCIGRVQEKDTYCDMCIKRAKETLKPFDVFVDGEKILWVGEDINDAIYTASTLLGNGTYKTIEAHKHYESKEDLFNDGYQRLYAQKVAIKESDYLRRMTVFSPDVPNGTGYMMFNGEIVPVRFLDGRGWHEVGLSIEDAEKALSEYPVWEDVIQAYSDFKSTEHAEKWWNSSIRSIIS